ncbi:MAG: hypothetical protein A4E73_00435 [Syntrophaceae bacterium PtaU1.Bin231]|nr:MAG: hypothetical protein A4E73_00435 [Syntrophaceae bacterium PtaU1.Bin231]
MLRLLQDIGHHEAALPVRPRGGHVLVKGVPPGFLEAVQLAARGHHRRRHARGGHEFPRAAGRLFRREPHVLDAGHVAHDHPARTLFPEQPDHGDNGHGACGGRIGVGGIVGRLDEDGVAPGKPGEVRRLQDRRPDRLDDAVRGRSLLHSRRRDLCPGAARVLPAHDGNRGRFLIRRCFVTLHAGRLSFDDVPGASFRFCRDGRPFFLSIAYLYHSRLRTDNSHDTVLIRRVFSALERLREGDGGRHPLGRTNGWMSRRGRVRSAGSRYSLRPMVMPVCPCSGCGR